MAETVNGLTVHVHVFGSVAGADGSTLHVDETYERTFGEGTGTNQVGSVWQDKSRALNTTSEDLDVSGGLMDFQGAATALNNVKVLMLQNLDLTAGDYFLLKQGSAAPVTTILGGTSPTITIGPDGLLLLVNPVDGYTVTATTADKIAVEAADDSTYKLILAGDNA